MLQASPSPQKGATLTGTIRLQSAPRHRHQQHPAGLSNPGALGFRRMSAGISWESKSNSSSSMINSIRDPFLHCPNSVTSPLAPSRPSTPDMWMWWRRCSRSIDIEWAPDSPPPHPSMRTLLTAICVRKQPANQAPKTATPSSCRRSTRRTWQIEISPSREASTVPMVQVNPLNGSRGGGIQGRTPCGEEGEEVLSVQVMRLQGGAERPMTVHTLMTIPRPGCRQTLR